MINSFTYLFILFISINEIISVQNECFRASVYEHTKVNIPSNDPLKVINNNLNIFEKVIKEAKKYDTKLIVFPEASINPFYERESIRRGVSVIVPKIDTNICEYFKKTNQSNNGREIEGIDRNVIVNTAILRKLSCFAAENDIYIAANVLELENKTALTDYLLFNTDVVFDNKGKLISKYRKFHLFSEPGISHPSKHWISTFTTEFGKFGIAICAVKDLAIKENIDHLILSTNWLDAFPSFTALAFHSAISLKYGFNILSANNRKLQIGSIGSIIQNGKTGIRAQTNFDNRRLLIADLPISKKSNSNCSYSNRILIGENIYGEYTDILDSNTHFYDYNPILIPLNPKKIKSLNKREDKLKICDNEICCYLEYKMNSNYIFKSDKYHLTISNMIQRSPDPNVSGYVESCSLLSYDSEKLKYKIISQTQFDYLKLNAKFDTDYILSNVGSSLLNLIPKIDWSFKQNGENAEIVLKNLKTPINFVTLFARKFEKDPPKN